LAGVLGNGRQLRAHPSGGGDVVKADYRAIRSFTAMRAVGGSGRSSSRCMAA
jgi:hypothetical protein